MRTRTHLPLPLAFLLFWSAGCGAAPTGDSGTVALTDEERALLDARAEEAAAQRERDFLDAMAREGVFPVTDPAQATVKYHREDMTYGLYNEAYVAQSDYYSQPRMSANYKVVDNIDMGALWKSLDDEGFFQHALPGVVRVPGATLSVVVRRGQDAWTLAWATTMDQTAYERTRTCANAVSALYNATLGMQVIENPDGADYFERERERLREQNANRSKTGGSGGAR